MFNVLKNYQTVFQSDHSIYIPTSNVWKSQFLPTTTFVIVNFVYYNHPGVVKWYLFSGSYQFSSVQLLSHVRLFVTPWTAARQASLSVSNYLSLLKLKSIESVMPSNHLLPVIPFSCLQSFPASGSFLMSQFFASGGQNIGVLASASVLPMNIQDWFPLGWTGWISLQSKGLLRVLSNITVQEHQFFGAQLSL